MATIHIRHTRKLVLAIEDEVVFDLHLVYDLDLHSVENITMTWFENITWEVTSII